MAEENENEIEVVVDDGAGDPNIIDTPKVENDDPLAGMELLKQQLAESETRRQAAEAANRDLAARAGAAQSEVHDSNIALVDNAISTVKQNSEILKANYAEALRVGDFSGAAEINSQIADNSAKLLQLEQGREALKSMPKQEAPRHLQDPVEALATQLTPRSADWVRKHPEFARDSVKYQKMVAAHNLVVADGIEADSDRYFDEVEKLLRVAPAQQRRSSDIPENDDPTYQAAQVTGGRGGSPPAAPVSRSGTGTGGRSQTVRLTPAQREAAEISGMTEKEYAEQLLKGARH